MKRTLTRWPASLVLSCSLAACFIGQSIALGAAPKKDTRDTIGVIRGKPKKTTPPKKAAPSRKPAPLKKPPPRTTGKTSREMPVTPPAPAEKRLVPTFYVSPGGKDPYWTIAAALAKVPEGGRVLVRTGVYHESLLLTRAVEIAPASPTDVVVIESPRGAALTLRAAKAAVREVTFRMATGAGLSDYTIEVPQGSLGLEGCTIHGADVAAVGVFGSGSTVQLRKSEVRGKKRGLHVFGHGKATLEECTLLQAGEDGALATDAGELTAKACRFGRNGQNGLTIRGARAVVDDCDFSANGRHGIAAYQAAVTLMRSRAYENTFDGFWLDEKTTGTVESCESFRNARTGFVLRGESDVHVAGCKLYENRVEGLVAGIKASGTLERCEITRNQGYAVLIKEESAPTLRQCLIVGGEPDTVHITERSQGSFEGCDISKSGGAANVAIHDGAAPVFRQTRFHGGWWGAYLTVTQARFEDCDFYDTAGPAIEVLKGGAPRLILCRIRGAKQAGVLFLNTAAGTLDRCEIRGTEGPGLKIQDGADPKILNCTITGSKVQGLHVERNGKGTLMDCTLARNGGAGAGLHSGSLTVLKNCRIEGNSMGVQVSHEGKGTLDGCLITGNAGHGIDILLGGDPVVKGCTVSNNRGAGIMVRQKGRGVLEPGPMSGNLGGNLVRQD